MRNPKFAKCLLVLTLVCWTWSSLGAEKKPARSQTGVERANTRNFTFRYRFRVTGLQPKNYGANDLIRVWLPCASSNEWQDVKRLKATAPAKISENTETRHGNRLLFFETKVPVSGEFFVEIPYEVSRREVLRKGAQATETLTDAERRMFLSADKFVPISGKPLDLLASAQLNKGKLGLARQLYDIVDDHVTYKKVGTGWGRGDSNWVCQSGYGNCTDFHSLFMSLARSQGLPARFEIGFSIPTDRMDGPISGYHCWAWFYADDRGWIPVDISEADKHPEMKEYYFGNLTADRVMFSTGRDLELVPKARHEPINFFIYPHIEVGSELLPAERVELQFAFENR